VKEEKKMVRKIMVVDDDPDIIFTVKEGLELMDDEYEVISAGGGKECLEILQRSSPPDLIVLDIMMPELSGWQVLEYLQEDENWSHIPIIFLSARTDPAAKRGGKLFGKDYIEKPFDIDDLKLRIDQVLEKKHKLHLGEQ